MNHPISPPPGMVRRISLQALESFPDDESGAVEIDEARDEYIANFFTQWGADQELKAVEEEIIKQGWFAVPRHRLAQLRAARRPKPLSLKERLAKAIVDGDERAALKLLEDLPDE